MFNSRSLPVGLASGIAGLAAAVPLLSGACSSKATNPTAAAVESVEVTPSVTSVAAGNTVQLNATAKDARRWREDAIPEVNLILLRAREVMTTDSKLANRGSTALRRLPTRPSVPRA